MLTKLKIAFIVKTETELCQPKGLIGKCDLLY